MSFVINYKIFVSLLLIYLSIISTRCQDVNVRISQGTVVGVSKRDFVFVGINIAFNL